MQLNHLLDEEQEYYYELSKIDKIEQNAQTLDNGALVPDNLSTRTIHEEVQALVHQEVTTRNSWSMQDARAATQTGKNTCSQYSIPVDCKNVDEPGCHWIPYQCPVGWILGGDDVQGNVVSEYTDCCVRGTCQEYETDF